MRRPAEVRLFFSDFCAVDPQGRGSAVDFHPKRHPRSSRQGIGGCKFEHRSSIDPRRQDGTAVSGRCSCRQPKAINWAGAEIKNGLGALPFPLDLERHGDGAQVGGAGRENGVLAPPIKTESAMVPVGDKIRRTDDDFAVAWIHNYGNGRVFYCSLGHRNEIFWDRTLLQFYLDGIQFALGDFPADATPSAELGANYLEKS